MRGNVENLGQPFANELVEALYVPWGVATPRMGLRRRIHAPQEVLEVGWGASHGGVLNDAGTRRMIETGSISFACHSWLGWWR